MGHLSLSALKKAIKDEQQDNKDITNAYYPPALTGGDATTLGDRQRSIKVGCVAVLALGRFRGVTPVVQSQPSGVTHIAWLRDMARDASSLLDWVPIPSANRQTAAAFSATIRVERPSAIDTQT